MKLTFFEDFILKKSSKSSNFESEKLTYFVSICVGVCVLFPKGCLPFKKILRSSSLLYFNYSGWHPYIFLVYILKPTKWFLNMECFFVLKLGGRFIQKGTTNVHPIFRGCNDVHKRWCLTGRPVILRFRL
jgi:hypothetical protein